MMILVVFCLKITDNAFVGDFKISRTADSFYSYPLPADFRLKILTRKLSLPRRL